MSRYNTVPADGHIRLPNSIVLTATDPSKGVKLFEVDDGGGDLNHYVRSTTAGQGGVCVKGIMQFDANTSLNSEASGLFKFMAGSEMMCRPTMAQEISWTNDGVAGVATLTGFNLAELPGMEKLCILTDNFPLVAGNAKLGTSYRISGETVTVTVRNELAAAVQPADSGALLAKTWVCAVGDDKGPLND